MDLFITDTEKKNRYAIELKFPRNGQYPETMFSFVKDIKFLENQEEIEASPEMVSNEVTLDGYICKKPIYRKTPFGREISDMVAGVTKLSNIMFASVEEKQVEDYRKMFLAMGKDIRVILIKLADRLHNMRTLKYLSRDRQIANSKETMELYAPLANRLGMYSLKWELEDLSFKYLYPEE